MGRCCISWTTVASCGFDTCSALGGVALNAERFGRTHSILCNISLPFTCNYPKETLYETFHQKKNCILRAVLTRCAVDALFGSESGINPVATHFGRTRHIDISLVGEHVF